MSKISLSANFKNHEYKVNLYAKYFSPSFSENQEIKTI